MKNKVILIPIAILIIFITTLVLSTYLILKSISSQTKTDLLYFPKLIGQAQKSPTLKPGFNFILLGLDPRDDQLEKTETTDTIIIGHLSTDNKINLISIPRDLWDYTLSVKINQIYPLSIGKSNSFDFIQSNFSRLIGLNIDRTLIITTKNLIDLVGLVGGVDVTLDQGFEDDQYPNPEYIRAPSLVAPKYITIKFPAGLVHLNETNVTEFVRSRKGAETAAAGGTDIGRIKRQQLLIDALLKKIKSPEFLINYRTMTSLYKFWHSDITSNFSDIDFASLGLKMYKNIDKLTVNKTVVPTGEDPKKDIIYHPKTFINKQWVFIPQDTAYKSFHKFISDSLNGQI